MLGQWGCEGEAKLERTDSLGTVPPALRTEKRGWHWAGDRGGYCDAEGIEDRKRAELSV